MDEVVSGVVGSHHAIAHTTEAQGFRERRWVPWLLFFTDVLAIQLSLVLGLLSLQLLTPVWPMTFGSEHLLALFLCLLLLPVGFYFMGFYPGYGMSPVEYFRRCTSVTFIAFGALFTWGFLFGEQSWPRGLVFFSFGYALVLPIVFRVVLREWLTHQKFWGTPVVVVGATDAGELIAKALTKNRNLGLVPIGYLDDRSSPRGEEVNVLPYLGPLSAGEQLADQVRVAVLAMPRIGQARLGDIVKKLPFSRVIVVPDFFGLQSLWISSIDMGGVLGLEVKRNLLMKRNRILKRLLDYTISLPLAALSFPILAVFALLIKLASPGAAFYAQRREGHQGKEIKVWKLRTMHSDAEARLEATLNANPDLKAHWERHFKLKNDPRIIPGIGQFLRKTSLDELPQIWNVLVGDMSLVGPRPFPYYHLESFDPEFRRFRHSVMPGITGFWQVSERSDGDLEVQETLDSFYIRNWSPWLDVYLLARTPWAVLFSKGAY